MQFNYSYAIKKQIGVSTNGSGPHCLGLQGEAELDHPWPVEGSQGQPGLLVIWDNIATLTVTWARIQGLYVMYYIPNKYFTLPTVLATEGDSSFISGLSSPGK